MGKKTGRLKQQQMFQESDGPLAKACDELVSAHQDLGLAREAADQAQAEVIEQLRAHNKSSVKHEGRTFSIAVTEAKERIVIRE